MNTVINIINQWLKANLMVFQHRWDGPTLTLIEVGTAKELSLDTRQIVKHRFKDNPQGHGKYLNLAFADGKEVILTLAGFAFGPSFQNTGPIPDAPPVSCMHDYYQWFKNLKQILQEEDRRGEAILLFNVLISILDGAKLIGLNVSVEEEGLEKLLTEFEGEIPPEV
jgi:prepilin-type processing-associated H-X9-DG protein